MGANAQMQLLWQDADFSPGDQLPSLSFPLIPVVFIISSVRLLPQQSPWLTSSPALSNEEGINK